jgi:serine/threonine protein kinase
MPSGSLLNSRIGDYQLVDFLGAGGMGDVYRAVHSKIGKVVAIKVLTLQKSGNGEFGDRFINEARIQARLHHQGIATLYDYSDAGGHPCIIMEYVGGQTLDELIRQGGPFNPVYALKIFLAVSEAVSYIHSNSIVHRDIKSNNIKIDPAGEVKLLDFGIAKSASSPKLTAVGDVIGTFAYMAPELLRGGIADARSDIWALGILLYEMLLGDVPFRADTMASCSIRSERAYTFAQLQ